MLDESRASASHILHNRKLYVIVGVVIVALIITGVFFAPKETTATQLSTEYIVGEKMIYASTTTTTYDSTDPAIAEKTTQPMPLDFTETVEIIAFDGQYYTLNHTTITAVQTFSWLEEISKTGFSNHLVKFNSPWEETLNGGISNISYISQLMSKSEIKTGDTHTTPYSGSEFKTGELKLTFRGYEDLTTSAGTFHVFKVEMTSENLSTHLGNENTDPHGISTIVLNYTLYIESGTTRLIKSTIDHTITTHTVMRLTEYENTNVQHSTKDMVLEQLIKP